MANLSALSGMSAQQIQGLNQRYPQPKLSLGGPQGSQWGAGRDGGFVWHGQGPAPQMTKDQILADMGFMSSRGGWNPNGGGMMDPSRALNPGAIPGNVAGVPAGSPLSGNVQTGTQPGVQQGVPQSQAALTQAAGNPTSGQKYGLSGAEDALQRGFMGGVAGIEAGMNQAANTLSPYTQGGGKAFDLQSALSGALGPQAQQQAFANYNESPEVAYQRQQGEKAILRNAAATGGLGGGNVQQALQRHAIGLAQQDYGNSFNRLGTLSGMGQNSANLLGGLQANAGSKVADMAYGTGGQQASYRTRAGEQIANNAQNTSGALSGLINQQGQDLSNIIGQSGQQLSQLLASYGITDAQSQQALAALLANISSGSASQVAGLPGVPGGNPMGDLGALLQGGAMAWKEYNQ